VENQLRKRYQKLQAIILSLPTPDLVFPCRKTPVLQHQIMVLPDDLVPTVWNHLSCM
jgi:hypothetical protein